MPDTAILTLGPIRDGQIRGSFSGPETPLSIIHNGIAVAALTLTDRSGTTSQVSGALPASVLTSGAGAVTICDDHGTVLATIPIVVGDVTGDDLVAEMAQLRAELDMVKTVLRDLHRNRG